MKLIKKVILYLYFGMLWKGNLKLLSSEQTIFRRSQTNLIKLYMNSILNLTHGRGHWSLNIHSLFYSAHGLAMHLGSRAVNLSPYFTLAYHDLRFKHFSNVLHLSKRSHQYLHYYFLWTDENILKSFSILKFEF